MTDRRFVLFITLQDNILLLHHIFQIGSSDRLVDAILNLVEARHMLRSRDRSRRGNLANSR